MIPTFSLMVPGLVQEGMPIVDLDSQDLGWVVQATPMLDPKKDTIEVYIHQTRKHIPHKNENLRSATYAKWYGLNLTSRIGQRYALHWLVRHVADLADLDCLFGTSAQQIILRAHDDQFLDAEEIKIFKMILEHYARTLEHK